MDKTDWLGAICLLLFAGISLHPSPWLNYFGALLLVMMGFVLMLIHAELRDKLADRQEGGERVPH